MIFPPISKYIFINPGLGIQDALSNFLQTPALVLECRTALRLALTSLIVNEILRAGHSLTQFEAHLRTDRNIETTLFRYATLSPDTSIPTVLNPGDAVFIQGHPHYRKRHYNGSGQGENVIFVGKTAEEYGNKGEEWLFMGFGPIFRNGPVNLKTIWLSLYKEYTEPMNDDDKKQARYRNYPIEKLTPSQKRAAYQTIIERRFLSHIRVNPISTPS